MLNRRGSVPWVALITIGLLWWILINHLRVEWAVNPQYAYGFAVPFLAGYLFWLRWKAISNTQRGTPNANFEIRHSKFDIVCIAFLAFLLLPIRIVEEANPEWRLISWCLGLVVVGITLLLILRSGGWTGLRNFAFPVLFFLVSIPWPTLLEQGTIQGLTRGNVAATLELLGLAGIPALQQGNLIEISTGMVGVDEACSGIRSLQATLMISLFFGEWFRLHWKRRISLVAVGFLLAFFFNILRTSLLVWVASRQGISAMEKWHDPAGATILIGCFAGLWLVAEGFKKWEQKKRERSHAGGGETSGPGIGKQAFPFQPAGWGLSLLLGWLILVQLTTELWYRSREIGLPRNAEWTVQFPVQNSGFKEVPIAEAARRMLRFSEGGNAMWDDGQGRRWQMFYARWNPGRTAVHLAKSHTPEVCLAAIGRKILFASELKTILVHGLALPYRVYVYEVRGHPVHVFYSLWEDRASSQGFKTEQLTLNNRLGPVLEGRRNRGQRSLLTAVWGAEDIRSAESAWQQQLEKVIVIQPKL